MHAHLLFVAPVAQYSIDGGIDPGLDRDADRHADSGIGSSRTRSYPGYCTRDAANRTAASKTRSANNAGQECEFFQESRYTTFGMQSAPARGKHHCKAPQRSVAGSADAQSQRVPLRQMAAT